MMMALSDFAEQRSAYKIWSLSEGEDNRAELSKVKRAIQTVMDECVTASQKTYMMYYFVDGMTVREIAEMCGVHPSTVSRGIHRGVNNAYRHLRFASPVFTDVPQQRLHLGKGCKHRRKAGEG